MKNEVAGEQAGVPSIVQPTGFDHTLRSMVRMIGRVHSFQPVNAARLKVPVTAIGCLLILKGQQRN